MTPENRFRELTQNGHFSIIPGDGALLKQRSKEIKALLTQRTIIQPWLYKTSRSADRKWDPLVLLVSVFTVTH